MNEQNFRKPNNNESIFKFIMPVLLMAVVQLLVQLFAGQLMFFYKGYTYTGGTYDDFVLGYQEALLSDRFTIIETIASTLILTVVFLLWYRREIVHAANVSLRQKCKVRGVLNWRVVPGVILISVSAGIFATYVVGLITFIKPDLVGTSADVSTMIELGDFSPTNIILILYFVILSPICQELVFRGLTMGFAERRMPFVSANIIQALLFGTLSMNVPQMIYYFVFGLVLGYVYYKTENITIPVICNMLFCITRLIFNNVNVADESVVLLYVILFAVMAAIYLGVILIKKAKIQKEETK